MIDFEFQWMPQGHWYRTAVDIFAYKDAMNSGMLHGKPLHAVRVFYNDNDHLVYNFALAKSGRPGFEAELGVVG